jgi:ADP-ribose pyrophosphatase YjhB (NUDIX family)
MQIVEAVGGIVYRVRTNQALDILLIKKKRGRWSLPKGKLNPGEAHATALLREIGEETGISGVVEDLVGEAAYQIRKPSGPRRKVVAYFLVRATAGQPRPDRTEGIVQVEWVPLAEALQRLHGRRLHALLRAAQSLLGPIAPTSVA